MDDIHVLIRMHEDSLSCFIQTPHLLRAGPGSTESLSGCYGTDAAEQAVGIPLHVLFDPEGSSMMSIIKEQDYVVLFLA